MKIYSDIVILGSTGNNHALEVSGGVNLSLNNKIDLSSSILYNTYLKSANIDYSISQLLKVGTYFWLTSDNNGDIYKIDSNLNIVDTIPAYYPNNLTYNSNLNRIYLSSGTTFTGAPTARGAQYYEINTATLSKVDTNFYTNNTNNIHWSSYNSKLYTISNHSLSTPTGTLWNNDGWVDITNYTTRAYGSFYQVNNFQIGNNILNNDFIMHDTINSKYYKVKFTVWQQGSGGAFAYDRAEILSANTFGATVSFSRPTGNPNTVDAIDTGLTIKRNNTQGIFNSDIDASWGNSTEYAVRIFDQNFTYISSGTAFDPNFTGTKISTNEINGKTYLGGIDYNPYNFNILIGDANANMSTLLSYPVSASEEISMAFNIDLNVLYVTLGNSLKVIDGVTNTEITSINLSTYGDYAGRGITYENGKLLVVMQTGLTGTLLDINTNTYAVTVINTFNVNGYSNAYFDGTYNYFINYNGSNPAQLWKWDGSTSYYADSIIGATGINQNNTHTLPNKSGRIAHLDDATVKASGMIYVDSTFGDDATGTPYNMNKPFQTVNAANIIAQATDTIVLLPGSYQHYNNQSGSLSNLYRDGGSMEIRSGAELSWYPYNPVVGGSGVETFTFYGDGRLTLINQIDSDNTANKTLIIKVKDLTCSGYLGLFASLGTPNSQVKLVVDVDTWTSTSLAVAFHEQGSNTFNIKARKANWNSYGPWFASGIVLQGGLSVTGIDRSYFEIDELHVTQGNGFVFFWTDTISREYYFKGNIFMDSTSPLATAFWMNNGTLFFEGSIYSNERCLVATSQNAKVYINNSRLVSRNTIVPGNKLEALVAEASSIVNINNSTLISTNLDGSAVRWGGSSKLHMSNSVIKNIDLTSATSSSCAILAQGTGGYLSIKDSVLLVDSANANPYSMDSIRATYSISNKLMLMGNYIANGDISNNIPDSLLIANMQINNNIPDISI